MQRISLTWIMRWKSRKGRLADWELVKGCIENYKTFADIAFLINNKILC